MRLATKLYYAFFLTSSVLLGSSTANAQSNSNYLQLLEGEAKNLTLDTKTKAKKNKTINKKLSNLSTDNGRIPQGLSFDAFMTNLKINYIGTYFFAKRLGASQQNEIYEFYKNNNEPQSIRSHVIKLSKKK